MKEEEEHMRHNKPNHRIIAPPICVNCQRLHAAVYGKWGMYCDAFPDGIPDAIIGSRVDHRKPVDGDHGLQFLATSNTAAADAAQIIDEARPTDRPTLHMPDLSNDWLYAWGDLPTTLEGLRAWLKQQHVSIKDFKNSARYEANYDRFSWLKDL